MFQNFFIQLIVKFLLDGLTQFLTELGLRKRDENTTKGNTETLENAQTDEQLQDAANGLAGHLGRAP